MYSESVKHEKGYIIHSNALAYSLIKQSDLTLSLKDIGNKKLVCLIQKNS
jgi:hypothetical protein